ncbi:MAG: response regulator transcription factor [Candidatus Competibacteraceae bacterium]|nr:response regulator transcription factor [Candidatus Competibacteraceae bacterium]MCB1809558.1 response regulator transcription factor [Candidatus Competibacteraceae bacterium]MCB1812607.1 response regulator transcription factor [Candidatus Competibacteraceae bacterium]
MRVLVIEDEAALQQDIAQQLRQSGYAVDVAGDGQEGLFLGQEYPLDVAIIDLGLPKMSGIEVIRELRSLGKTFPILILTARGRWQDKVDGLEAGADDYLVKPFHMEELLARLRALVRRASGWAQSTLQCGPIGLDTASQSVTLNGQEVVVTAYEYKLLEHLMLHAGDVVSKTELSEHLYEEELDRDSNVLEVLVGRLRRKLDPDRSLNPIETLRGRGYRLRLPRTPG